MTMREECTKLWQRGSPGRGNGACSHQRTYGIDVLALPSRPDKDHLGVVTLHECIGHRCPALRKPSLRLPVRSGMDGDERLAVMHWDQSSCILVIEVVEVTLDVARQR